MTLEANSTTTTTTTPAAGENGVTNNPPAGLPPSASGAGTPQVGGAGVPPVVPSPLTGGTPATTDVTGGVPTNVLVSLGLNPDLLGHDRLKGISTVEDLANALVNANLAPPVVKPEEYQLPQGVPEDVRGVAHSLALTQDQLNGILEFQANNFQAASQRELEGMAAAGQQKLTEWGAQAKENLELGKTAVGYIESKSPGLVDMLNKTGYGNHPVVMELFRHVGDLLKEGGFNKGEQFTPAATKNRADRMFPTQANNK